MRRRIVRCLVAVLVVAVSLPVLVAADEQEAWAFDSCSAAKTARTRAACETVKGFLTLLGIANGEAIAADLVRGWQGNEVSFSAGDAKVFEIVNDHMCEGGRWALDPHPMGGPYSSEAACSEDAQRRVREVTLPLFMAAVGAAAGAGLGLGYGSEPGGWLRDAICGLIPGSAPCESRMDDEAVALLALAETIPGFLGSYTVDAFNRGAASAVANVPVNSAYRGIAMWIVRPDETWEPGVWYSLGRRSNGGTGNDLRWAEMFVAVRETSGGGWQLGTYYCSRNYYSGWQEGCSGTAWRTLPDGLGSSVGVAMRTQWDSIARDTSIAGSSRFTHSAGGWVFRGIFQLTHAFSVELAPAEVDASVLVWNVGEGDLDRDLLQVLTTAVLPSVAPESFVAPPEVDDPFAPEVPPLPEVPEVEAPPERPPAVSPAPVPTVPENTPVQEGEGDEGLFDRLANRIGSFFDSLANGIGSAFGWLGDLMGQLLERLIEFLDRMLGWLGDLIKWLGNALLAMLATLQATLGLILNAIRTMARAVVGLLAQIWEALDAGLAMLGALLGAVLEVVSDLLGDLVDLIREVLDVLRNLPEAIVELLRVALVELFVPSEASLDFTAQRDLVMSSPVGGAIQTAAGIPDALSGLSPGCGSVGPEAYGHKADLCRWEKAGLGFSGSGLGSAVPVVIAFAIWASVIVRIIRTLPWTKGRDSGEPIA